MRAFSVRGVAVKGFYGPNAKTLANPTGAVVAPSGPKTWTTVTTGFEAVGTWFFGSFANGLYFIGSWDGTTASFISSATLSTFTNHNVAVTSFLPRGITFGAGLYVAVLDNRVAAAPVVYTTPDLTTWTQRVTGFSAAAADQRLWQPVFGNGVFLLVSQAGPHYATSSDGITWTQQSSYVPTLWGPPIFDGTQFVAAVNGSAATSKIATSTDGIHWTESTATLTFTGAQAPFSVGHNGTAQYIVGNEANDNGNSLNGALSAVTTFSFNDSGRATAPAPLFSGLSWARNNLSNKDLVSSYDGTHWLQDTVPATATSFSNLAYGGNFIAVGSDTGGNNLLLTRGP